MSILIERATSEERAAFFKKNKWVIARIFGSSDDAAEEKPKRKRKTTRSKAKSKTKPKTKSKAKAKAKETPAVVEKKTPKAEVVVESNDAPTEEVVETNTSNATDSSNNEAPKVDDLTQVDGLGPKMAESLAAIGITTFSQLAALSKKRVQTLGKTIRRFAGAYETKNFKKQAKELAG